jgi:hypothetical protein
MTSFSPSFFRRLAKGFIASGLGFFLMMNLALPFVAHAQEGTPETSNVVIPPGPGSPVLITGNVYEEIKKKFNGFFSTLTIGGVTALMNAFQVFTQRIAYDAAQRILTGDAGQYPMFWEDGFGPYLEKVAEDAGNQFITSINSEVLSKYGFDLCTPLDPFKLQASLSLGTFMPPETLRPTCTAAQIGRAYDQVYASLNDQAALNTYLASMYKPSANELNVGIAWQGKALDIKTAAERAALLNRQETQGLKNVQDFISGKIKTPAQAVKDTLSESNLLKMSLEKGRIDYSTLAGNAFKMGFTQLAVITASTFVSTLASGLLQKIFGGLTGGTIDLADLELSSPEAVGNSNVARARLLFADLLTPNLISSDQQDFVTELSSCPTPRGMWNCAMDDAFAAALRTVGENGAYTVGRAAHVVLNGQPPANPAFLHKDWELIPESDVKEASDPTCYQRAYCAPNLAKLRYARILPVGWEMAANSPYNTRHNGRYATLEDVIRGFNVCNDQGTADASHPWCKLIDPNWVLSAPPFQCRVKGAGDTVLPGTGIRFEECADAVSCLGRDDRGKCTQGYGFCMAEKPVWRFPADACLERFASCRTYTNRGGQRVSYLRNTIDYGSCSADNIGCLWYATERGSTSGTQDLWTGTAASGTRIYLDASVKTCPASAEGCTRVLTVQPGLSSLNLVNNGSFEHSPADDQNKLIGWTLPGAGSAPTDESAVDGSRSLSISGPGVTTAERIDIAPLRNYTVTVSARPISTASSANFTLTLSLRTQNDTPVAGINIFKSASCTIAGAATVGFNETIASGDELGWRRYECSFVSNPDVKGAVLTLDGSNVALDAIQLEEAEKATNFVDGIASGLAETHLRIAPDEFQCQGLASDLPACAKYARVCRQTDQGCQGYRDLVNTSAPEIPASLSVVDACPAACVGYAEYRKQPSAFDLGKNADPRLDDPQDDTSANFIPALAQQCSLADVGCEVFTNVETAAQGGEETAAFNYVRACEKPGENSETYFTWEGSDTTGYQLRTWSLIHNTAQLPNPPKILQKTGPDGILKDSNTCTAQAWETGVDPDCRQFFNANGVVFYAYFSQTVISSPDCRDFRKTGTNAADCEKTGGSFTPASGECIYKILSEESRSCNRVNAGCRAYIGTTGRNTAVVFEENFRGGTSTALFTAGELSNESILVGDQSLKITGASQSLETSTVFPAIPNQLYSISFWAKTTSAAQQTASILVGGAPVATFPMQVDWRRYEFGPFAAPGDATSTLTFANLPNASFIDQIRIERLLDVSYVVKNSWTIPNICDQTPEGLPEPQAMLGCRAYQDRSGNAVTVRRFGQLCREESIGCKAFVDTRNSESPYSQTFALKGTDVNSGVTPESQAHEALYVGTVTTTRAADRYVYLIDEPGAHCQAEFASCTAFGKPKYAQDQLSLQSPTSSSFQTMYFIDDVNAYLDPSGEPGILCRKNELFCDEFKSGKTVAYFRNPDTHACEWKDKVVLSADAANGIPYDGEYAGWFRTGTDVPCYPGQLSSGNTYLIQNSGDPSYVGWVGNCPVEQSECTEFRDPNDTSDPAHPSGKPYFFLKNARLDLTSCNGTVDLLSGCVLFRDMSDARNRFSTVATYAKSKSEADTPQTPIDCVTDPSNPFCANAGRCAGVQVDSRCQHLDSVGPNGFPPPDGIPETYFCPFLGLSYADFIAKDFIASHQGIACSTDSQCTDPAHGIVGRCELNNSNAVLKVKLDRDCAQWLGCSTAETVYDPAQGKYVDVCTDVAVCDVSKGSTAGSFCAHYVDRTTDPVLKPGAFFDRKTYASRETGFGKLDYSGYAIPDRFQISDIQNRRVGQELFQNTPTLANKFATDYRLVASVTESTGLIEFGVQDNLYPSLKLCRHIPTGRIGYTAGTTVVGQRTCYFSVDALSTRSSDLENLPLPQKKDPRNIQTLADILRQSVDPKNDTTLQQSLPPAECKAYPENDAPFPNLYVKEWNTDAIPFRPKTTVDGYSAANFCEFGEDCACSYRKARYGTQFTKYVSPFGKAPPAGICSGGQRDGQACVPGQEQKGTNPGDIVTTLTTEDPGCPGGGRCIDADTVTLVRGQFGQCLQRDFSRTVGGDPGRHPCLIWNPNPILSGTYDTAHYIPTAGYLPPVNAGEYYCLSYSGAPIDTIWTAESHVEWDDARQPLGDGGNPFFYLPGKLAKFNYDRGYIAGRCPATADRCGDFFFEGSCNCWDGGEESGSDDHPGTMRDFMEIFTQSIKTLDDWLDIKYQAANPEALFTEVIDQTKSQFFLRWIRYQNLGTGIDGVEPENSSDQAKWCAAIAAWKEQDKLQSGETPAPGVGPIEQPPDVDVNLGRWIQTGTGIGKTYAEYFVPVKPKGVLDWLNNGGSIEGVTGEDQKAALRNALMERQFAQFLFYTVNDPYLAACRLPTYYVDGVTINNYGDPNEVFAASKQIYSQFSKEFDGTLDRSKELIVKNADGKPVKETCSGLNDGQGAEDYGDSDGRCYMKAWETNYRMDGADTFEWLDAESGTSFWDRHDRAYFRERTCSKSGFAIRALFENTSPTQNQILEADVKESDLNGPYQFIGFWITACTAGTDRSVFAYLGLRVKHADICKDVAQTISPFSRESAAFTDRVWQNGSFSVPVLGYNYSSSFGPFGSALANGTPGIEPLFQTGGPAQGYSILKPPTFLGSGQSYTSIREKPIYKWGHLTNIFARIYRIYRYYDQGISRDGYACVRNGKPTGIACPNPPNGDENDIFWKGQIEVLCGGKGVCNETLTTAVVKSTVHKCNGLSGVNAGLDCGGAFDMPSQDPVCHNAAMKNMGNGAYEPQLTTCAMRAGWDQNCSNPAQYKNPNDGLCYNAKTAHEKFNAFGCGATAVVPGAGCSAPSPKSIDCPLKVENIPCLADDIGPHAGHCGNGYEHARCRDAGSSNSTDCVFTASQWWGAYDDGKPDPLGAAWPSWLAGGQPLNASGTPDVTPYSKYETFDLFGLLGQMAVRYYPADPANKILPPEPDGVANGQGYALPINNPAQGGTQSMSNLIRRNYEAFCDSRHCAGITDGSTYKNFAWTSPFAAFVRWGAVTRLQTLIASDAELLKRWPAPNAIATAPSTQSQAPSPDPLNPNPVTTYTALQGQFFVMPGMCEGANGAFQDPNNTLEQQVKPAPFTIGDFLLMKDMLFGKTFAPTSSPAYYDPSAALKVGRCDGGQNDGAYCFNTISGGLCEQGADVGGTCEKVATINPDGSQTPTPIICTLNDPTEGDSFSLNPDLDNNACTRGTGYRPLSSVCGDSPNNEKCLLGYSLGVSAAEVQTSLNEEETIAPTDVTGGLHTPIFLGLQGGSPADYQYISYYAPRPPTIAAPDVSRTCQTPGSCPISSVGSFALESQSSGPVSFSGGQAQVNMRFYGWAAQDQTPLTSAYVDWGDGSLVEITKARMKNKKPFCGVTTECELVPGLTCKSDADCPPAGGKCVPRGTCNQNPGVTCSRDIECQSIGKPTDKCVIREMFGNSEEACEANYFDFTHAYACNPKLLPNCNSSNLSNGAAADFRCLRRPDIVCNALSESDIVCGGDPCVAGLAPPPVNGAPIGGCFDTQKNICMFTPRVMLKDSFNWCTGECRTVKTAVGYVDSLSSKVKHVYGGCWDGTETSKNTNINQQIMLEGLNNTNECSLNPSTTTPANGYRPWIVYPGAVEIGVIQ